ncbi:Uncharacterized conserved protein, DUF2132 family [Oceanospirillum multiglobuliferum]|uniref:DNA-binding protein VF530 n=1 Tax=Oceanospirillum multiglobuliferum TaxID=64969 RepID=A0A1T4RY90_9GAMM|nr:VF530 family DNA-binding protein [Oceanospirillum multiglobuliferum]OPX54587.1 hypothetical protein BTE48_13480 [Oceanospirillum multiglobuliferum]SKA20551.1 Uncharacterized conserved protein, DUF2132 family [Oceanospirillum multiglobuliferum]
MTDEINYKNNPLHGVSLKTLLTEMVDHYGFTILHAYLNINCFKTKPSIESSVKFLKKTDWAREKVEAFYLYQFKNLPRASADQFALPPRDRIVPSDQKPKEPAALSLEDAERLREKREKKAAERKQNSSRRPDSGKRFGTARSGGKSNHSVQKNDVWQQERSSANRPEHTRRESTTAQSTSGNIWNSRVSNSSPREPQTEQKSNEGSVNPWTQGKK